MLRTKTLAKPLLLSHLHKGSGAWFLFSTWYSPESLSRGRHFDDDPFLIKLSTAIRDCEQNPPLESSSYAASPSLKKLMPSLTVRHVIDLIDHNPLSLPPRAVFSFFNLVTSRPGFRLTLESYFAMVRFLVVHEMVAEARSLIGFVVSRKGKNSASTVFSLLAEMRVTHLRDFFVDALMLAYADLGFLSDAIQCFRWARKNNFGVPIRGCGNLLDRMMKSNPPRTVWEFYMEVLDSKYPPNVYFFNILMNKFCKEGKMDHAQMVFDEMAERSLRPTVVSFNTLINGYCKTGNLDEGFRLKLVMEERRVGPDVFTYSVLINGLCKENRMEDAHRLFDEMCERGLIPNDVTFTTLIHGQCRNRRIDLMTEIYQKMLSRGLKPDIILYNTLINGFCKNGDLAAAKKIVNEMSQSGLRPDKVTYTTLIDGFCKEGDLEGALEIRKEMDQNGIELDSVAFAALVSGMCKEGRVIDAERTLREMLRADMKPDDVTYTMVMDAFCKKGDVKMGFKLLKEMQSDGHVPGVVTYNVLLNGLCKLGQMKNADMLLDAMLNLGVVPDDITYNILLEGHYRHVNAADLDELRSERGVVADFASYKSLVNELYKTSKHRRNRL